MAKHETGLFQARLARRLDEPRWLYMELILRKRRSNPKLTKTRIAGTGAA